MKNITVETLKNKQVVDITEEIQSVIVKQKIEIGICNVFVKHTTCCLALADLDPGTDEDFLDALDGMFPKLNYRHAHDPGHVGEHIMSSIIGPSISIPFQKKKLVLGTWQSVVLVELSGPRKRNIVVSMISTD